MTKLIISLFFLLIFLTDANGQVDNVTGQYVDKGNILLSPGAESGVKGWTNSAGTFTVESTGAIVGQRVFKVVLSSQTLNLRQDSTKYATEYADGIQLLGYARVKTSVSGVKLCPRKAGVTQTSLCVSHTGSGKWELLKVPFISSGTSNGLALITDTAKSGTVYVDDAFVGAVDLKVDGNSGRRLLGTLTISGCTQSYFTNSTTYASFGTSANCTYSATGLVLAPTTQVPGFRLSYIPQGILEVNAKGAFGKAFTTTNSDIKFRIQDLTNSLNGQDNAMAVATTGGQSFSMPMIGGTFNHTTDKSSVSSFEIYGLTALGGTSASAAIWVAGGLAQSTASTPIVFEVWSNPPSTSTYSSTNANYDWTPYTPTLSGNTNFGCNLQHMRSGPSMKIKGVCTWTGTGNTAPPRFTLPNSLLTSFDDSTNITINRALDAGIQDYSVIAFVSGTSGIALKRMYIPTATNGQPIGADNSFPFTPNAGDTIIVNVEVPIQGWEQSNILIGQFNGLESCTDSYQCTDTFSAKFSSTATTSDESIEWVTGNGTIPATGRFSYSFKTDLFTVAPNCTCSVGPIGATAQDFTCSINSVTTSGVILNITNNGVAINTNHTLVCQKQGPDFVSKTAKAVASDQNVRSIGAVGVDIQSVYFGSGASCLSPCNTIGSCTVCTRVGSKITSVEAINTTGFYRLNGIDGTKYICNGQGLGGSSSGVITHELGSSASTYAGVQAWNAGSGAAQGRASVTCIGVP